MKQVQLYSNRNQLTVPVTLNGGKKIQMRVESNEAFYDSNGYIRQLSMKFDDGIIGNFYLLPKNSTIDDILTFADEVLAPFGLTLINGKVFAENKIVNNISKFITMKTITPIIHDAFDYLKLISNSAYFEIASQELVITHPIKLSV